MFIRRKIKHILLVQIYVYDIVFGFTDESLCKDFASLTEGELKMSLMGELTYFLGLQIKQAEDRTFISQLKYYLELLKKFDIQILKSISPNGVKYANR